MRKLFVIILVSFSTFVYASGQSKNSTTSISLDDFSGTWTLTSSSIRSYGPEDWEITVAGQEITIKKTGGQGKQPANRQLTLFVDGRRETNTHFRLDGTQIEIRSTTKLKGGKIIRKYEPKGGVAPMLILPQMHIIEISETYYLTDNGKHLVLEVEHTTASLSSRDKYLDAYKLVFTRKS